MIREYNKGIDIKFKQIMEEQSKIEELDEAVLKGCPSGSLLV